MQDRYVGDIGDFAKYALLRRLAGLPGQRPMRVAVVWCLFPDEIHNSDGRHISYLGRAEFAGLDDELRVILREIVHSGSRCISAVAAGGVLPCATVFYDAPAASPKIARLTRTERARHRLIWLENCLGHTDGGELVFFDPDNGFEVPSVPKHHPNAGKYIYWDELAPFWSRGQTLLIYHHLNRTMPAARQVRELAIRIRAEFDGAMVRPLVFRRGSCRVFWLVFRCSGLGTEMERRALELLNSAWSMHFHPARWHDRDQILTLSAR